MPERLEDRLRDALDLLTERVPLRDADGPPPRRTPGRTPAATTRRRLPPVLALAAAVVVGLILLESLGHTSHESLQQVTGPPDTSITAETAAAPPSPTAPRPAYPDAPTVSASPLSRAMLAFGYGTQGHWTWFVVDGADHGVRAAADLPISGDVGNGGAALSPDGRLLAYSVLADATPGAVPVTPQVVVVDLRSGHETRFAADATLGPGAWSPDGARLAWVDRATHHLVVAGSDGRPAAAIPVAEGRTTVAWSPDGGRMAVAGCLDKASLQLSCPPSIVDAGTLVARDLPEPMAAGVVWSPDGRELVDGDAAVPTFVAADGSGRRQLPDVGSTFPLDHLFSPDGGRMLVRPSRSGLRQPYARVVDVADGGIRAEPSDPDEVPTVLGWKGDQALLVARDEPGAIVLYAVPLDGSARQRLVSVTIHKEDFGAGSWLVADWFTRA